MAPLIGPPPFNDTHINPQPNISLTPNSSSNYLHRAPNIISLPFASLFWRQSHPGLIFWLFMRSLPCLCAHHFLDPKQHVLAQEYVLIFPVQWYHGVIEPDPFNVQSHLSIISCDQGSFTVHTSFWALSQPVGYNEGLQWKLKTLSYP